MIRKEVSEENGGILLLISMFWFFFTFGIGHLFQRRILFELTLYVHPKLYLVIAYL